MGQKFIVIIDEWDVLIRDEAANKKVQEKYINFLRAMFKGTEPTKYIQLAYLTGILPIKKACLPHLCHQLRIICWICIAKAENGASLL